MTSRAETVLSTVEDLVGDFLYYHRKEDSQLPPGEIEAAIRCGEVTMEQIIDCFVKHLAKGLSVEEEPPSYTAMVEAIGFYANPETYFAVGFFPDPPCGEFMDDFSETGQLGRKPGKRARQALGVEDAADEGGDPTATGEAG